MTNAGAHVIAAAVAAQLVAGEVVNLGIGIPTLVLEYLDDQHGIHIHTENGMLGVGPPPADGDGHPTLVNAGKQPVTETPGCSYFSSAMAFGMIRGGHVDTAVIGALQVDRRGLVANWIVPGRPILGVGGAMDLMVGARRVIVAMSHLSSRGEPKIVPECRLPITAQRSADLIVTDRATFRVDPEGLVLESLADGTTEAWLAEHTPATYRTHESGVA